MPVSLETRLSKIVDRLQKKLLQKNAVSSFPGEWLDQDETGERIGPPQDAPENELRTYQVVLRMLQTIEQ